jgi:hypothetical protein
VLGARGFWVAGIGAGGEAGGIECEPLAVVAATPVYTVRQPTLATGNGTIRLRPEDAAGIPPDELGVLTRAALKARPGPDHRPDMPGVLFAVPRTDITTSCTWRPLTAPIDQFGAARGRPRSGLRQAAGRRHCARSP